MGSWNAQYTHRKQKEMLAEQVKRAEREKAEKLMKPKPLYINSFGTQRQQWSNTQRHQWQLQKQKEKWFWILGSVIIVIVAIASIFAIVWAAS